MRKSTTGTIRRLGLFLAMSCWFFWAWGTDAENTKNKILEIKLDENFIFGEGISDNKEIAYGDALEDLLAFANELKIENAQEKIAISDLITKVETLTYNNGDRFEVIVYIPFKIIIDTPKKSDSNRKSTGNQRTVTMTEKEVPTPKPVNKGTELLTFNTSEGGIEDFLITQENFTEIKSFLSDKKQSGEIKETGASESTENVPSDANVVLIDELGGLIAFLSPETNQGRFNYKTKKPDSVINYNSKFIVWYRK